MNQIVRLPKGNDTWKDTSNIERYMEMFRGAPEYQEVKKGEVHLARRKGGNNRDG